jgi:nicotinate phosphoribosyltransferase
MSHAAPQTGGLGHERGLLTDLYELTMLQVYRSLGMEAEAVFDLFVRRLPPSRNFLLACGLEDALSYLEGMRFTQADIAYLERLGLFDASFLRWLETFRFRGDVYAVPEGTPVFPGEPLLAVVAPLPDAQVVESRLMNIVHFQTLIATKARRVVDAAAGRRVVDFGMRRTHGAEAALMAARASYVAGVHATSNVLAGSLYGIPVAGTMAHSFVQAHEDEIDAFRNFVTSYPETTLLVDTYDTIEGVRNVIRLSEELGEGFRVKAVRLDSGDLLALARESRRLLDAARLERVQIFASGSLDEYEVERLVKGGAPIDGFGVGTHMGVSSDVPALDMAYKLTAYAGEGRMKTSSGKRVLPGRKQVFRTERGGEAAGDVLALFDEHLAGRPLLRKVMESGRRLADASPSLEEIRAYAESEVGRLSRSLRRLERAEPPYPVTLSPRLAEYSERRAAVLRG